jgi:glycosyltransferase involved in cell wall biosynthesis
MLSSLDLRENRPEKCILSIVVPVYRSEEHLSQFLESYIRIEGVELIVVDGGSGADVVSLLKKYGQVISYWVSEPDNGIYDAMNKGARNSKGVFLFFMGVDDEILFDEMKCLVDCLGKENTSEMMAMPVSLNSNRIAYPNLKKSPPLLHHQGWLTSRRIFDACNGYSLEYALHSDYDLMLRARSSGGIAYYEKPVCAFRRGGRSTSGKNFVTSVKELLKIYFKNDGSIMDTQWIMFILRPLSYLIRARR